MAQIFYRAQYTAPVPGTIADGFTITLSSGYSAVENGVRGYFVIIDESSPEVFANVIGTVTGGNNLKVNRVEYDGTRVGGLVSLTNALPILTGTVKIMSSLPLTQYGNASNEGLDGVFIMGDDNAVGNNGGSTSAGYHPVLDTIDTNILMYRAGKKSVNSDHTAYEADIDEIEATVTVASEPLPHNRSTSLSTGIGPVNSVGFGIPFAKHYYYKTPGTRRVCILPAAGVGNTIASVDSSQENGLILLSTFKALGTGNKASILILNFGVTDAIAGLTGPTFESRMDSIIASWRVAEPRLPVVVCEMPAATITAIGGTSVDINNVIKGMPTRHEGVSVATPGVYTLDSSSHYIDAPGQRTFGKVIFEAVETALDNQIL